jgi:hypothetical protein
MFRIGHPLKAIPVLRSDSDLQELGSRHAFGWAVSSKATQE